MQTIMYRKKRIRVRLADTVTTSGGLTYYTIRAESGKPFISPIQYEIVGDKLVPRLPAVNPTDELTISSETLRKLMVKGN
jgi:hypothetical protein